ncbi:MAG: beta strand repeat-containing protein [Isosphaerales bacterium]
MSKSANPSKTSRPTARFWAWRPRDARPRRRQFLPRVDLMEDRTLLSTLTVMNHDNSGSGSLRAAITIAASGDTINFANSLKGQTITLTSGPLALGVNLTINGLGANKLTVSGGGTEGVFVVSAGVVATIDNLTIANGLAVQGAGIDNFGTLMVSQCTLTDNTAVGGSGDSTTPDAANGGGIANEVGAGLTLTQSLLTNNVAAASPGNDSFGGALLNLGSATIANSTFTGNQVTGGGSSSYYDGSYGGAIESFGFAPSQLYGSTLTVSNSTFTGNQAIGATGGTFGDAGAIDVEFSAVATISNTSFTGNEGTGGAGCTAQGGALFAEGCTLTLSNTSFAGNQAIGGSGGEGESGAVLFFPGATVNISNSSFTANLAQGGTGLGGFGGAVMNEGGTVTLSNSTLTANRAIGGTGTGVTVPASAGDNAGVGGGILNSGGTSPAGIATAGNFTLSNCTLSANQAIGGSDNPFVSGTYEGFGRGGGIENDSDFGVATLTVSNSALINNLAQGGTNSSGGNGQGQGGGINNFGANLSITNSVLIGNRAVGAAGGSGVAAGDGFGGGLNDSSAFGINGTASVTNTTIARNLAKGGAGASGANGGTGIGGGIAVAIGSILDTPDTSSLALSHSAVIGNVAQGGAGGSGANGGNGWGGGAFVGAGGSATFDQTSIIIANLALGGLAGNGGSDGAGIGGGLYVATGASVSVKKTNVNGNFASASNDIYGTVTYI